MPRSALFIVFAVTLFGTAAAQEAEEPVVDFMLRPTQDISDENLDDLWDWDSEPEPSMLEREIGPPILGPEEDISIGPPLAGPGELSVERLIRNRRTSIAGDPFAATGINVGSFVIRPAIEVGVTATDNVSGGGDKVGAVGLVTAPELNVRSEGERHDFEADLRAEGIFYDREEFNTETAEARARGRYDLTSRTSLLAEAGYARFLEDFTDPDTPGAAVERPGVDAYDASIGVKQEFGRIAATVTGFAERSLHEDVPLAGGGLASREELDNTEYGARLRTSIGEGASLAPFTEIAAGHRDFDQELDDSGFQRSSLWGELRGGLLVNRGEKLGGEFSLGYRREELEDERLGEMNVFLANAALLWSPRRLTEVRFDLSTETSPTSVPNVSGTVTYAGLLSIARSVTPRVRVEGGAGLDYERPIGDDWRDLTFTGYAEASYAFNRMTSLEARYVYERTESTLPDGDSDEHEVGVRIRLQR